jgi:hypothetical protein
MAGLVMWFLVRDMKARSRLSFIQLLATRHCGLHRVNCFSGIVCRVCADGSCSYRVFPVVPAATTPHIRPRYLDEALARQFTTAVCVGKKSKEAGKSIKEVGT